jgi:molybdate transport system permease protein
VLLSPAELEVLGLSLKVAFWGVLCSLPVALALAYLLARAEFPGKILLDGIVHLPLVLPPVVIGYLLLVLLGRNGPLGAWLAEQLGIVFAFRWTGAALAASVMGLPLAVRAMRQAIASVTLPLILPGVLNGMLLSFARSLGEFGATITFVSNIPGETQTLPLAIYSLTQVPGGDAQALRLCVLSVAISLSALVVSEVLLRRVRRRAHGS